jgi:hypothetical protein
MSGNRLFAFILDGESHRAIARRGNGEQERRSGSHAEDFRAVDARRARRLGREDNGFFAWPVNRGGE